MSRPVVMGGIASRSATFNPDIPASRTDTNSSSTHSRNASVSRSATPDANEAILRTASSNPPTYQFLKNGTTLSSGPSKKEPALITSTWGIGWQTPTLMFLFYIFAALIAISHLLLFRYLHGREADGPNAAASQTYVSTASNILANSFGFTIRASLALAFTQYLWYLLRAQTMKVSTIELLFSIRTNPFQLLRLAVIKAAPTLCALAVLMWATQIVTGFPPGALNVVTAQQIGFEIRTVPTFNASFMGNGSGADANANALVKLDPDPDGHGFTTGDTHDQGKSTGLINRLSRQILIGGEEFALPSPCGANCSFSMELEGPYVFCNDSTTTATEDDGLLLFNIYSAQLSQPEPGNLGERPYNGTFTQARFNATTLTPLSLTINNTNSSNDALTMQVDSITCTPGRAKYILDYVYTNNTYKRNVTTSPISELINLDLNTHDSVVFVPGFCNNTKEQFAFGTTPANWTDSTIAYYRDNNMMAIFNAMMSWLNGTFIASLASEDTTDAFADPVYIMQWEESIVLQPDTGVAISTGAQDRTIIDSTRFNSDFGQFNSSSSAFPSFAMSQETLNAYLLNLTTSIALAYGRWSTPVNATTLTTISVYDFSQPLNLIVPYFLTLLLAIPFLAVGYWALLRNGVSAIDGGFMQIVATTTGSDALDKAAAGGCLGGTESIPQEFKELEIKFGEIVGGIKAGRVRRAGFGVESEISSLTKGADYGIARWI